MKPVNVTDPCFQNAAQYPSNGNNEQVIEEHATDQTPQILLQNQVVFSDENQEAGNKPGGCISVDCKVTRFLVTMLCTFSSRTYWNLK